MWMNKCRKYRIELALLAGNDLDVAARLRVERHAATCPDCRALWHELRAGQQVLDQARDLSVGSVAEDHSVWSGVRRQIRVVDERSGRGSWRGWLPAAAMAAACLAVVLISSDLLLESPADREFTKQPVFSSGLPVMNPAANQPTIVPAGAAEFAPELLNSADQDGRPRRKSNRAERLSHGAFRGF